MDSRLKTHVLDQAQLPLIVEPTDSVHPADYHDEILTLAREVLPRVGAILFRGFQIGGVDAFEAFAQSFGHPLLTYDYQSTPRSNIAGRIYTSTEYPATQAIPLHNEMSYTLDWPLKIWFYSIEVAPRGGETPIADSRDIYRRIRPALRDRFAAKGVMYVRNYRIGLDLPWQKVFNTEDPQDVETFCRRMGIEFQWKPGGELATRQVCQAVAMHPRTGEMVWLNQAHLFHVSSLEPRFQKAVLSLYSHDQLPRNALYGDGSPIDTADLDEVRQAIDAVTVAFPWQREDVLMLDNMLVAHGRHPFDGSRKVAVAMAEPVSSARAQATALPGVMHA
jgi:alpha-ketoglutarate-dependent taurine dioxygenase